MPVRQVGAVQPLWRKALSNLPDDMAQRRVRGLGAAAGALLGSASGHAGPGAAIGAGSGLVAGGLLGGASGRRAAAATQNRYDMAYTQCIVAQGERIVPPAPPPAMLVYASPPVGYVPVPVYAVPPPPRP